MLTRAQRCECVTNRLSEAVWRFARDMLRFVGNLQLFVGWHSFCKQKKNRANNIYTIQTAPQGKVAPQSVENGILPWVISSSTSHSWIPSFATIIEQMTSVRDQD
jgi:hypothetical protein